VSINHTHTHARAVSKGLDYFFVITVVGCHRNRPESIDVGNSRIHKATLPFQNKLRRETSLRTGDLRNEIYTFVTVLHSTNHDCFHPSGVKTRLYSARRSNYPDRCFGYYYLVVVVIQVPRGRETVVLRSLLINENEIRKSRTAYDLSLCGSYRIYRHNPNQSGSFRGFLGRTLNKRLGSLSVKMARSYHVLRTHISLALLYNAPVMFNLFLIASYRFFFAHFVDSLTSRFVKLRASFTLLRDRAKFSQVRGGEPVWEGGLSASLSRRTPESYNFITRATIPRADLHEYRIVYLCRP